MAPFPLCSVSPQRLRLGTGAMGPPAAPELVFLCWRAGLPSLLLASSPKKPPTVPWAPQLPSPPPQTLAGTIFPPWGTFSPPLCPPTRLLSLHVISPKLFAVFFSGPLLQRAPCCEVGGEGFAALNSFGGVPVVAQRVKNLTHIHEDEGLIPGLTK